MTQGKCSDPIKDAERLAKISAKLSGRTKSEAHCKHLSETRIRLEMAKGAKNPNWKGGKVKFTCTICGKEILIKQYEIPTRKTCGDKDCIKKVFSQQRIGELNATYLPKVKKQCPICGKTFEDSPVHSEARVCCSHKCMGEYRSKYYTGENSSKWVPKIKVSCLWCGTELERLQSDLKLHKHGIFCSTKCHYQWNSENLIQEKSHLWRGGVTDLYYSIRTCMRYHNWRKAVYERDNYCDWLSGLVGDKNLVAHHIIPFNRLIKKYNIKTFHDAMACDALWDIDNGITMFKSSHLAYHSMWGKQ